MGLEYFHEVYNWQTFETLHEGQGQLLSDYGETRNYVNTFLLAQWRASSKLLIDAAINVNQLSYELLDNFLIDSLDQSGQYQYNPVFSPRVGLNLQHHENFNSYFSAGHGFSAPSVEETLLPDGNINSSLKPETGWNIEIGNRTSFGDRRLTYDLAFYSIYLENLLVTERLEEDIFTGVNAGTALNTGLEILLKAFLYPDAAPKNFNSSLSLVYNYSKNAFLDFVDDGNDYTNNNLPGIPKQELKVNLNASWKGLKAATHYRYSGSLWMTDANDITYKGHQLVDLNLGWTQSLEKATAAIKIYGGI